MAAAADRFVVIVSSDKLVERLSPPIPLELLEYGLGATLRRLGPVRLRDVPLSPDGGVIADFTGAFDGPERWPPGSPQRSASSNTGCSRPSWSPTSWWLAETTSSASPSHPRRRSGPPRRDPRLRATMPSANDRAAAGVDLGGTKI